jgi:hypothetical protein
MNSHIANSVFQVLTIAMVGLFSLAETVHFVVGAIVV